MNGQPHTHQLALDYRYWDGKDKTKAINMTSSLGWSLGNQRLGVALVYGDTVEIVADTMDEIHDWPNKKERLDAIGARLIHLHDEGSIQAAEAQAAVLKRQRDLNQALAEIQPVQGNHWASHPTKMAVHEDYGTMVLGPTFEVELSKPTRERWPSWLRRSA